MGAVFLVMFIFLGYLTAFYQNQQQPQPRERDYFYVGAFFVYSMWIGLGVKGLLDMVKNSIKNPGQYKIAFYGILVLSFLLVPFNMAKTNWFTHDRSRNFVPWDYSYNLLQSVKPNAVIFTNGDNDTFPLWYLQEVEGVRQDVRIANLSLLNTDWYIKQLKNTSPHGAKKVKFTYSDAEIERLGPMRWNPKKITVAVPKSVFERFNVKDTAIVNRGRMTWLMKNPVSFGNVKAARVQDLAVLDIIQANKWERPIYFAVTCSEQSKIGLADHLKMEGLAFHIVPYNVGSYYESVDESIMRKQLFDEPEGFSKDYKPGFKFRGLNDPTIFMDENHKRLTINYRNAYIRLALNYLYVKNDNAMTIATLDKMEEKLPRKLVPLDYRLKNDVANIYWSAGAKKQYVELAREVENECLKRIERNPADVSGDYNSYFLLKQIYDNLGEYGKFVDALRKLEAVRPGDKSVQQLIQEYTRKVRNKDTTELSRQNLKIN
jgi:tetratricopeptide (TPR) repeat protein